MARMAGALRPIRADRRMTITEMTTSAPRGPRTTRPRTASSFSSPPPARMIDVQPNRSKARTMTWIMLERPV